MASAGQNCRTTNTAGAGPHRAPRIGFILLTFALILAAGGVVRGAETRSLVILHTTDEHSYLLGVGPEADDYPPSPAAGDGKIIGGAARRATLFARERALAAESGADVLTFSSGDTMMGTLFEAASLKTAPDYRVMKALRYDAGTFGNHDFELSPAFLAATINRALSSGGMVPIVATNTHFSDNDPRDAALKGLLDETGKDPTKPIKRSIVLKTEGGLKVGVIGVLGAHAAYDSPGKTPIRFSLGPGGKEMDFGGAIKALCEEVQPVVDRLRTVEKVDLVVALGHTGTDLARPGTGESFDIARSVAGIDVFLSGHTHLRIPPTIVKNERTGKDVVLIESGRYGDTVGKLVFRIASDGSIEFDRKASGLIPVDSSIPASPQIGTYLDEAIKALEGTVEQPGLKRSMLERTLSTIEGSDVRSDSARPGSLYFRTLGKTAFALPRTAEAEESGIARLVSDAFLDAGSRHAGPTDISMVVSAIVRDGIWLGRKGTISFADIFRILPLGQDITASSLAGYTPGFPLVRVAMNVAEIKGILDATVAEAMASSEGKDYFAVGSRLRYEFDTDRPPFDPKEPRNAEKGQITKVLFASDPALPDRFDTVFYDRSGGGWRLDPTGKFLTVVIDYYLAPFLLKMGVHPLDPVSMKALDGDTLRNTIVRRPDGSPVKGYEALASFINGQCRAGNGYLAKRYDSAAAERAICRGSRCK